MNARNSHVLFGEHDRLKNDWQTIAVAYISQRHPFTSHMQPIAPRQPICFSIPQVKPALTELPKQYFKSVFSGKTRLALCSSLSIKSPASVFLPHLILLLSVFFTESYSSFLLSSSPPPPLLLPFVLCLPPPYSTLLIFKSHMLPARLAQLHPANEGLFIGLRLSAAKQGLARAEAGASLAAPPPPSSHQPQPPTAQTTPHACSGLALSPRRRLLVSAALNCRQQLKRARERDIVERGEGTVLAC